jgi:hypothetical protein
MTRRGILMIHRSFAPISQPWVLAVLAVVAGLAGILSTLPWPAPVRVVLLTTLLLTGAGSALLCWLSLSDSAAVAGVIGVSVATVIAFSSSLLWLNLWHPVLSCVMLSVGVLAVGSVRLWTLWNEADR